jgi:hypothetical protein
MTSEGGLNSKGTERSYASVPIFPTIPDQCRSHALVKIDVEGAELDV